MSQIKCKISSKITHKITTANFALKLQRNFHQRVKSNERATTFRKNALNITMKYSNGLIYTPFANRRNFITQNGGNRSIFFQSANIAMGRQTRSKYIVVQKGAKEITKPRKRFRKLKIIAISIILIVAMAIAFFLFMLISMEDLKNIDRVINSITRFVRTMICGAKVAVDYKWNLYGLEEDSEEYKNTIKPIHKRSAEKVLELCRENAGLYIKAGQYIASLNHILPIEFTSVLRVLQDRAPYKSFEMVEEIFKEDFGYDTSHFFKEIDHVPLASASLAQVHRALTFDDQLVAVKVQYSQLQGQFKGDMMAQQILLYAISKIFNSFDVNKVGGEELRNLLRNELDFFNEAANIHRARENLTVPRVSVPRVFPEMSSKRVLTMEFIDGCKINDAKRIKEMGFNLKEVYTTMFTAFAEQIFLRGFFHSDPHPGNIFVRKHPNAAIGGYEVVILDHGLYQTLKEKDRVYYCHLWKSLIEMDHRKIKFYTRKLGVNEKDYILFSNIILMRTFNKNVKDLTANMTDSDYKQMHEVIKLKIDDMFDIMQSMPNEFMLVLRNHNLLRSLNLEMGVPVNRFAIFGRMAVKGLSEEHKRIDANADFFTKLKSTSKSLYEKYRFEFKLKMFDVSNWVLEQLVTLLPDYFMRKFIEKTSKPNNAPSGRVIRAA